MESAVSIITVIKDLDYVFPVELPDVSCLPVSGN